MTGRVRILKSTQKNRLNLVILRLANVYGPYCSKVIGTMLCMARVYAYLGDEMKWLWTKDLRTHTVHVLDVARAVWHAADWYAGGKPGWDEPAMGRTPIFNVVDHGDTSSFPPQSRTHRSIPACLLTRGAHRSGLDADAHRQHLRY